MSEFMVQQQWILIALIFFGIMAYIVLFRRHDRNWIEKRFKGRTILAMSFGVNYFGRATEPGKPRKSSGFLLLLADELFYRSRTTGRELSIPGNRIGRVYPGTAIKGIDLHQSVVKIDFLTAGGEKDSAAFRVPYPPQWIQAIQMQLVKKGVQASSGQEIDG